MMAEETATAGETDLDPVVRAVRACRQEAIDARGDRLRQSRRNRDVFYGRQDWSHKNVGQSAEFLPKVANSVEQMASFIKRGLVQYGDWFHVRVDRGLDDVIDSSQIVSIMKVFLANLWQGGERVTSFPLVVSDAVKVGLLESLMIFKVHGATQTTRTFRMEAKGGKREMVSEETEVWQLRIDLISPEDYYPDPSGHGLYEIHRCEKDLHEVLAAAKGEDAIYDMAAVQELVDTSYEKPEEERRTDADRNQARAEPPSFRRRVVLDEFWGTILNEDGTVRHRNVVCTVANEKHLIRKPEPNPFWHQKSPIVVIPMLRVPFSVWHRAMYDDAADLNLAINEMFNLILDGGLASVWGVRQVRVEDLEDPAQVEGGIPQGATLAVKQTLPHGQKVVETVTEGEVPRDAMAVFEFLNREFLSATLSNEMKVGALPPRKVLATEVVEASQSQAVTLDGIMGDIEEGLTRVLELVWYTVLQNMDEIPPEALDDVIDRQVAHFLGKAEPEERFSLFYGKTKFKAFGLSATVGRAMLFQKLVALLQAVRNDPILMRAFLMKFSADKVLRALMRALNINVEDVMKDKEELAKLAKEMEDVAMLSGIAGGSAGGGGEEGGMAAPGANGAGGSPMGGGGDLAAEINQLSNTRTGLTPNA